jgi:glycosyltransferase involved in cell wall biosynthesis
MKVLFSHHNRLLYGGGGEVFVATLANYLARRGHRVEIQSLPIVQDNYGVNVQPELDPRVKYEERWLHGSDADVCYAMYTPILPLYLRSRCPVVVGIHAPKLMMGVNRAGPIPTLARAAHVLVGGRVIRAYDAVHIINKAFYGLVDHPRKYLIPNPIDSTVFRPAAPKSERFTVLYVGRRDWDKGWDVFLEVRRRLSGTGIQFIAVKGLSREQLARAYSSAHVLMAPARKDTFGQTIVEAMLCGTPVITTSIPAHRGLGLPLIYADTPEEMVEAIRRLMNDPPKIDYREAAMKYSIEVLGPIYEGMLREVSELAR